MKLMPKCLPISRNMIHFQVYQLKGAGEDHVIVTQTTVNRPLGNSSNLIRLPAHHFLRNEVKQYKDVDDERDHVIQEEQMEGFEFKLLAK